MGRTTLNCDTKTKSWFDELRPDAASSEDEFLRALLAHYDDSDDVELYGVGDDEPVEVIDVDAVRDEISMADEPDTERVINRIDDLETELTRQHEELGR